MATRLATGGAETIQMAEDPWSMRLDSFSVLLGIHADSVMVLDETARPILFSLSAPRTIHQIRTEFSAWSTPHLYAIIGALLATGIAVSADLKPPAASSDSADLLSAWLHLTNSCNLDCRYCYVQHDDRCMDPAIARRAVEAVFRSARTHGYPRVQLKYAGGEPSLSFPAMQAAQTCAEQLCMRTGIAVESIILTNGVCLTESQISYLTEHDIRVLLSIDGLGEYHEAQRPVLGGFPGSFTRVARTLDRLLSTGLTPFASVTITARNLVGLPELVDYLLDRNIMFNLNFCRARSSGGGRESDYDGLRPAPEALATALDRALSRIEQRLPARSLLASLVDRLDLARPHLRSCTAAHNYLVIDPSGGVHKCQMAMDVPITDITVPDPLAEICRDQEGLQNPSVDDRECHSCRWRYRCGGGCPRETFEHAGRYSARSPLCEVYRSVLPKIVRLEAQRLIRYTEPCVR